MKITRFKKQAEWNRYHRNMGAMLLAIAATSPIWKATIDFHAPLYGFEQ